MSKPVGIRLPTGWREKILERSGCDNLTQAILQGVATAYGLQYRAPDPGGRPQKSYVATVTTPHGGDLVRAVFDEFAQPWPATLENVQINEHLTQTMVSVECDGIVENSLATSRTKGAQLAREMATEIDRAAEKAET